MAPSGLAKRPLPDKPMEFDTAEGQRIRVVVMTTGPEVPLGLTFLPDGTMLVTERTGQLRIIRNGSSTRSRYPAARGRTSPASLACLAPCTATWRSRFIRSSRRTDTSISRTRSHSTRSAARSASRAESSTARRSPRSRTSSCSMQAGTSRMAFGRDGMLYVTTTGGDPKDPNFPQNPGDQGGKVLRLRDDGSIPPDNPFAGKAGRQARGLHARTPQPARTGRASRHRRDVANENGPERRRRDQHPQARRQLRLAARELRPHVSGPMAESSVPVTPASSRRSCTGCRRLPRRAWRSTPAIVSRSGRATSSSARCARARSRARDISSAFSSTRRWRSCDASRCSSSCGSGSATCDRVRTDCCMC